MQLVAALRYKSEGRGFESRWCHGHTPTVLTIALGSNQLLTEMSKGKAVPLQAHRGLEGSRKLRFPDFVTTAQDGGKLSALRTGRLYPQEIFLVIISLRG